MCGRNADSHPSEFVARLSHTVNALPNIAQSFTLQ